MKAVVMAGGSGTRLRPLSLLRPKPMVRVLDRPILEHTFALLRSSGITDVCVTLRYLSAAVTDHFGDGRDFGLRIRYQVEDTPLGTAGSVKACADFIGDDEFLVISGDGICDFDLPGCLDFHRRKRAEATLLLTPREDPLEYGLVLTDPDGRITRFVEKPAWDRVLTDLVNTGVYICSPRLLQRIPSGREADFGGEIFPQMLREGAALYGLPVEGYWCDVGNCEAYLRCNFDALLGRVELETPQQILPGVWSKSPVPDTVRLEPPCYIGQGVSLSPDAVIGPFAVIGSGSTIGPGARVRRSVVNGGHVDREAELSGAILCAGARVGNGSVLSEGTVVGDGADIGAGAFLGEGILVWPKRQVAPGAKCTASVIDGSTRSTAAISMGVLRG